MIAPKSKRSPRAYQLKRLILPNEHGSWGILLEPLIAGLAVAWSSTAPFVAVMFVAGFLMRQPLKIYLADLKARRSRPHTLPARDLAILFGTIAVVGVAGVLLTAGPSVLWPLLLAAPLGSIQLLYDAAGKSRRVLPELLGSVAISSSAMISALAAGWTLPAAAALSAIFVLRFIPSLLYVRERLRLEKGKSYSYLIPAVAHLVSLSGVALLVLYGFAPRLTLAIFVILLTRAMSGLTRFRQRLRAMQIGVLEVIYGLLVVLAVIVGHHFNL